MTNNCLHGNTVLHSTSLDIDKCRLCGAFLVWCTRDHDGYKGEKHWHYAAEHSTAIHLAHDIRKALDAHDIRKAYGGERGAQ